MKKCLLLSLLAAFSFGLHGEIHAQNSDVYRDYLSRIGEDNDLYYDVKMTASQLLLDNVENTFVTPVFNGSASLRDAAGALIENVTKSTRRNQTVDDVYMDTLFAEMVTLYRLDQIQVDGDWKMDLGPIPTESLMLLGALAVAWVGIGIAALLQRKKRK